MRVQCGIQGDPHCGVRGLHRVFRSEESTGCLQRLATSRRAHRRSKVVAGGRLVERPLPAERRSPRDRSHVQARPLTVEGGVEHRRPRELFPSIRPIAIKAANQAPVISPSPQFCHPERSEGPAFLQHSPAKPALPLNQPAVLQEPLLRAGTSPHPCLDVHARLELHRDFGGRHELRDFNRIACLFLSHNGRCPDQGCHSETRLEGNEDCSRYFRCPREHR